MDTLYQVFIDFVGLPEPWLMPIAYTFCCLFVFFFIDVSFSWLIDLLKTPFSRW